MLLPILVVKVAFVLLAYALRALVAWGLLAYRRPWMFLASLAVLPVLLALPEYIA